MKKKLMTVLALVLVIALSVAGTYAYLTSTAKVENTFTVGNVAITMDESKVDADGRIVRGADRVLKNEYKLIPGHEYCKDPVVHVTAGSEKCYVFVEVENGLVDIIENNIEEETPNIEGQIAAYGWTKLEGNVYYKLVDATEANAGCNLSVFNGFQLKGDINYETLEGFGTKTITVTAYAVQADGFETASAAWAATFGK